MTQGHPLMIYIYIYIYIWWTHQWANERFLFST